MKREKASKEMALAACGAMLKWLQDLPQEQVDKMRKGLSARGQKAEESRDWGLSGREWKPREDVIRTRTGYVYR